MRNLNISLIQSDLVWQQPAANRKHFEQRIAEIPPGTDLVIMPEMLTTGFTMDARTHAETMDGSTIAWMIETATSHNITLCGSLIIEENSSYYNRFIWVSADAPPKYYDKRHLFRMANEHQSYTAGKHRAIFTLNGWRICPMICYDLRFPVWSRGIDEFDLMIYVANWPAPRHSAWQTLLPARAIENQCYLAGVNRTGKDGNGICYSGDSAIIDFLGNPLSSVSDEPAVLTATLDSQRLLQYRDKFPAYLDADNFSIDPE